MLYNTGLTLGLSVRDIDIMTVGELLDLLLYRANQADKQKKQEEDHTQKATQADYDAF